jgi:MFS family permease
MPIAGTGSRVGHNARLVFIAKSARTFCYGALGVLLPVYLTELGFDARQLGIAVTLTLLASTAMTFMVRWPAERWGPRAALMAQATLIVVSAIVFLLTRQPWVVVAAAMAGNVAVGTGETGPFLSLEQVIVTRDAVRERLTTTLSYYNLIGYAAAGLGAAAVTRLGASQQPLFALFLLSGLTQLVAYGLMRREPSRHAATRQAAGTPSRPFVRRLAVIFALDSFAGGFVVQSLIAYWFYTRFGLGLEALGWIFFGVQILSGLSLLLAARVAPRLGLVNTMVFSHLISQMDVPTRQTFLMLAVRDHEREHAASLTNMSRTLAQSVSPALTGLVMQGAWLMAPFFLGGGLKIVYDLWLYATIRHVKTS